MKIVLLLLTFSFLTYSNLSWADSKCSINSYGGILNANAQLVGSCVGQRVGATCAAPGRIYIKNGICSASNQAGDCTCVKTDGDFGDPQPVTETVDDQVVKYKQMSEMNLSLNHLEVNKRMEKTNRLSQTIDELERRLFNDVRALERRLFGDVIELDDRQRDLYASQHPDVIESYLSQRAELVKQFYVARRNAVKDYDAANP